MAEDGSGSPLKQLENVFSESKQKEKTSESDWQFVTKGKKQKMKHSATSIVFFEASTITSVQTVAEDTEVLHSSTLAPASEATESTNHDMNAEIPVQTMTEDTEVVLSSTLEPANDKQAGIENEIQTPPDIFMPATEEISMKNDIFVTEVAQKIPEIANKNEDLVDVSHMVEVNQIYSDKHPNQAYSTENKAHPKRSTRSSGQIK